MILAVLGRDEARGAKSSPSTSWSRFGIRLNQRPPRSPSARKDKGGINCQFMAPQSVLDVEMVHQILREYKVHCADVIFRQDATVDQLIDVVEGNRTYMPCVYVLNKIDQLCIEELDIIDQLPHHVPISAHHGWNVDELLETVWEYCNMIRIYTKPKGQIPDYNDPVILHQNNPSIEQFCNRWDPQGHHAQFKFASVWGSSVKHQPQKCGKDHRLSSEGVVQV
ncbi:unnamed protein product, partial [Heterosigma akashiwo]